MNTAIISKPDFWAPVRLVLHRLWPEVPHLQTPPTLKPHAVIKNATHLIAASAIDTRAARSIPPKILKIKPLRVVRVLESGQARSTVGRMVISGRMADVCAELDRLAAVEAA